MIGQPLGQPGAFQDFSASGVSNVKYDEKRIIDLGVARPLQGVQRPLLESMKQMLADIQSGEYARDFILENRAGAPTLNAKRRLLAEHEIEVVGEKLRAMMPWIRKNKLVDVSKN